jgi:hypothetical protein
MKRTGSYVVQQRSDAKANLQQEQHRISSPRKVAKVHAPDTRIRAAQLLRDLLRERRTRRRYSIRKKSSCSNNFFEWLKRQTDVP